MPRVSIISDDRIFSDGVRQILSADSSVSFIVLPDRPPSPATIRAASLDVLLIDARTEGALELCAAVRQPGGGPAVLFVAVGHAEAWAIDALRAGGRGILSRSAPSQDIARAIQVVYGGGIWAPRHLIVAAWLRDLDRRGEKAAIAGPRLTRREVEVLRHAAAGLGNKEMADVLAISEATIKAHLTSIFQKLGVRGRARLAAAYHGIIAPLPLRESASRVHRPA